MPDAIVVGAGIIGLLCARELNAGGLKVVLLDRDQPGRQASWASAGIVGSRLPWAHSATAAMQSLSAQLWPELATQLRDESGMDVEFRENGMLYPAFTDDEASQQRREAGQLQQQGMPFEYADGAALRDEEPLLGPAIKSALIGPGGNVENRRACRALEIANRRNGVEVHTGVQVHSLIVESGAVRGVRAVEGDHRADVVVIASGAWSSHIRGLDPPIPVGPQRGQILAVGSGDIGLRRTVMKADDPYLVPRVDGRIVVGATREFAGFNRALTAGGVAWLLASAIEMVPKLAGAEIGEMWTGFRPVSADGIPLIGPASSKGLFYATGHGASGVGPAPGTARLLASQVLGYEPPFEASAMSPRRFANLAGATASGGPLVR